MSPRSELDSSVWVVTEPQESLVDPRPSEPGRGANTRSLRAAGLRVSVWTMIIVLLLLSPAQLVFLGWVTDAYRDTSSASEVSHRLHEVVFGVFFSLALAGAIAQVAGRRRNLAGLIQMTIVIIALFLMVTFTVRLDFSLLLYLVPLVGVIAFYGEPGPVRERTQDSPWAVVLTLIAAPAFLVEVGGHIARAGTGAQNHTTHWSVMAAFASVLLGLGAVVALGITGRRLTAWSLGTASIIYGIASLAFPYDASSHRPAYAVGLILWGLAWLVGISRERERPATSRGRLRRVVLTASAMLGVLILSISFPSLDTPANVPHRPDPDRPEVLAADVDRATCLSCHATGLKGAPQPPPEHPLDRTCDSFELCWGGRSDCAGCHRIDPALGGSDQQIQRLAPTDLIHVWWPFPSGGNGLAVAEISSLRSLGATR